MTYYQAQISFYKKHWLTGKKILVAKEISGLIYPTYEYASQDAYRFLGTIARTYEKIIKHYHIDILSLNEVSIPIEYKY